MSPEQTARLREAIALARTQLEKAADQFAFYADEHAKKRTSEGDAKGAVNHQWALACAKADHELRKAIPDLAALLAASDGVAEGWVLVPREPTPEMNDAATVVLVDDGRGRHTALNWTEAAEVYRAMLAAAPTSPAPIPATPDEAAIRADERERCAREVEKFEGDTRAQQLALSRAATAIRANQSRPVETAGEVERLREALRKYGRHDTHCLQRQWGLPATCDCGLDAALRTPTPSEGGAA